MGYQLVAASASTSNCMSLGDAAALERLEADPDRWEWFLDCEASLCRELGALDAGTHTVFAVVRDQIAEPDKL
jgi:hypothetical protein